MEVLSKLCVEFQILSLSDKCPRCSFEPMFEPNLFFKWYLIYKYLRLVSYDSDSAASHSGKADDNIFGIVRLDLPKFAQIDDRVDDVLNIVRGGALRRNDSFEGRAGAVSWVRARKIF